MLFIFTNTLLFVLVLQCMLLSLQTHFCLYWYCNVCFYLYKHTFVCIDIVMYAFIFTNTLLFVLVLQCMLLSLQTHFCLYWYCNICFLSLQTHFCLYWYCNVCFYLYKHTFVCIGIAMYAFIFTNTLLFVLVL